MNSRNPLAFRISLNGVGLIATPKDSETIDDALRRTIEKHTNVLVVRFGKCKMAGIHYSYPVHMINGAVLRVIVEGNAG